MSRRPPNASAERAAQNQQTLKTLVKIESNKSCADCKRNKHPRWASWNLGVFVCIRCSGIHRGMGTHISRVKSVDLDAWTDDQVQNMIKWGNARANRYWEAKLSQGHVPAEGKIENFIRTKYDSKRWVMDGGIPDPATLDGDDDDVPLTVVQEKARISSGSQQRIPSASTSIPPPAPVPRQNPDIDLFGDSHEPPMTAPKPSLISTSASNKPTPPTPPKTTTPQPTRPSKAGESLLGFDFFGDTQANVPPRPSSAASISSSTAPSRRDLNKSILSLYANVPPPASGPPPSTGTTAVKPATQQSSFGNLDNDFRSLNFGSSTTQSAATSARSSSAAPSFNSARASTVTSPAGGGGSIGGGGGFFDALSSQPAPKSQPIHHPPPPQRGFSSSSGFSDFASAASPGASSTAAKTGSNGIGELFDFSSSPTETKKSPPPLPTAEPVKSAFNLSNPAPPAPKPSIQPAPNPVQTNPSLMSNPWGSSDVWAAPSPNTLTKTVTNTSNTTQTPSYKAPPTIAPATEDWGWSDAGTSNTSGLSSSTAKPAQIMPDEDFGGWESSTIASPTTTQKSPSFSQPPAQQSSFSGNTDDLFSNVWE